MHVQQPSSPSARQSVVDFYDRHAEAYDQTLESSPRDLVLRRHVQQRVLERVRPGARVLDFGCGTGLDAFEYALAGAEVTGIDVSSGMIDQARRKFGELGEAAAPRWIQGGEEQLERLEAESVRFDVVVSNFAVLNTIREPGSVIRAFARLAAPGALVLVAVQNPLFWRSPLHGWWWRSLLAGLRSGSFVHDSPHWRVRTYQHLPRRLLDRSLPLEPEPVVGQLGEEIVTTWPRRLLGRYLIMGWLRA